MSFLEAFADAHRRGQAHFNRGEFERAFEGLAPDVEWHMLSTLPEAGLVKGRDAAVRFFQQALDAGGWQVDAQEFTDLGAGRVLIRQRGSATGRTTRISGQADFFQVWTVGDDRLTHEIREFATREEALAAAARQEIPRTE